MKNFIVLSALFAAALSAPTSDGSDGEFLRQNKVASYGAAYGPVPAPAPYTGSPAPIILYISPSSSGGLHYRAEGEEGMEHASARSYGGYAEAAEAALAGAVRPSFAAPVNTGPAVGLFPHARLGGCAVPLLLSCSPNIVSGHLVKSHAHPSYSAPSYRSTGRKMDTETEMKEASNPLEKNAWSEAERSSASGMDIQHVASINAPYHQHLSQDGQHVFPGVLPQSGTHMHGNMMHHSSHI